MYRKKLLSTVILLKFCVLSFGSFAEDPGFAQPPGPVPGGGGPADYGDLRGLCSQAADNMPLDGHILRLGFVSRSQDGFGFFFPDERAQGALQRVGISRNVGIIGQDPYTDFSESIWMRTPEQAFIVAQIFVADPSGAEPVVTCVSRPRPLSQFRPDYYPGLSWFDPTIFITYRRSHRFHRWNWKRWYDDDFGRIRRGFRSNRFGDVFERRRRPFYGKAKWLRDGDNRRGDWSKIGDRLRDRSKKGDWSKIRDRFRDRTKGDWSKGGDFTKKGDWSKGGDFTKKGNWSKGGDRTKKGNWSKGGDRTKKGNWSKGSDQMKKDNWSKIGSRLRDRVQKDSWSKAGTGQSKMGGIMQKDSSVGRRATWSKQSGARESSFTGKPSGFASDPKKKWRRN